MKVGVRIDSHSKFIISIGRSNSKYRTTLLIGLLEEPQSELVMSNDLKHMVLLVRVWQRVESGTYLIMRGASAQDALALMPFSDRHISSITMIRNRACLSGQCLSIGQISCLASRTHNPIVVSICSYPKYRKILFHSDSSRRKTCRRTDKLR